MRPVQAERLTEGAEHRDHARQVVRNAVRKRRGDAETGQINGYDIPLRCQYRQHRVPGLTMVADAVEQQQRIPGTGALVRHGDGPRSSG